MKRRGLRSALYVGLVCVGLLAAYALVRLSMRSATRSSAEGVKLPEGIPKLSDYTCPMCGMDSSKSETPYLVIRREGENKLVCGINCAILYRENEKGNVTAALARDSNTGEWFPIDRAFYVHESDLMPEGTMYPFVWPFKKRADAEQFIAVNGGRVLSYEEVLEILP